MIMSLIAIICWSSLFLISCSPTRAFTNFHSSQSFGVGFGIKGGQKQWAADKTRFFAINVPPHFGVSSWWMSAFGESFHGNRTVHGFVWGLTLHESGPPTLALLPIESSRGIQSMPTVECQKMYINITWNTIAIKPHYKNFNYNPIFVYRVILLFLDKFVLFLDPS